MRMDIQVFNCQYARSSGQWDLQIQPWLTGTQFLFFKIVYESTQYREALCTHLSAREVHLLWSCTIRTPILLVVFFDYTPYSLTEPSFCVNDKVKSLLRKAKIYHRVIIRQTDNKLLSRFGNLCSNELLFRIGKQLLDMDEPSSCSEREISHKIMRFCTIQASERIIHQ